MNTDKHFTPLSPNPKILQPLPGEALNPKIPKSPNPKISPSLPALFLRLALGLGYSWEVADRLGILGANGKPHVGWGDWSHFMEYARQVMGFLPAPLISVFAVIATIGEGAFGLLLLIGLYTRVAAIGSSILSLVFAVAMALSMGIESPIGYSVFTVSAASLLLATLPDSTWSLDARLKKHTFKNK